MHAILAYVCKEEELKVKDVPYVRLPHGFVLFTDHNYGNCTEVSDNIALISTDYFGGLGEQSAKLWLEGFQVEVKDKERPINEALKKLGVVAEMDLDEFDTIRLGYYRSIEDILEVQKLY